jgi:hypothetical protein
MKYFSSLFIMILISSPFHQLQSQEINAEIVYEGFFDNREYFHELSPHYSLFGNRLSPGLNLALNDSNRIHAGFSYLYEFGGQINNRKPKYYAYFTSNNRYIDFHFGIFPRSAMAPMRRALLNDTVRYFRPFMEGMGLHIKTAHGFIEGWVDWTSRQTENLREAFLIGIQGEWSVHNFFINHQTLALHFAKTRTAGPEEHIRDNIGNSILVGFRSDDLLFFDNFSLSAGTIVSFDRLRTAYNWKTPAGFFADAQIRYGIFSIDAMIYEGEDHDLMFGDNFFSATNYTRVDGNIQLFDTEIIQGKVQGSIHFIEGEINYSQLFTLILELDQTIYTFKD